MIKYSLSFFLFCIILSLIVIEKAYCTSKKIIYIPYGSHLNDIKTTEDTTLIFMPGDSYATTVENISLLGNNTKLFLQNSIVKGYVMLGDSSSATTYFSGYDAVVHNGITLLGEQVIFQGGPHLLIKGATSILGNTDTIVSFSQTALFNDISIGTPTSNNTLILNNLALINANIFIEGGYNDIQLDRVIRSPSSFIEIWGSSKVTILSSCFSLDFLHYNTQETHQLILGKGFHYTTNAIDLRIPLPNAVQNTLSLEGSYIKGDIILPPNIALTVSWASGTYLNGGIYADEKKTIMRGLGIASLSITPPANTYILTNFILGIQDKSIWNGDILGKNITLGVIKSNVNGNILLDSSNAYIAHSTIQGNIKTQSSLTTLDTITLQGNDNLFHNVYMQGSVRFHSKNHSPTHYRFSSYSLTVEGTPNVLFSTNNHSVGDILELSIQQLKKYSASSIFFQGDVDFTSAKADTLILNPMMQQEPYIIHYAMSTTDNYIGSHRITNVLQGFTHTPTLYRNTMHGYDIALVPNLYTSTNYDIVLLGYSTTNDSFAGASYAQAMHIDAMLDTEDSQLLHNIHILANSTKKGAQEFSLTPKIGLYYNEKTQTDRAPLRTKIITGGVGVASSPIDINKNISTILDAELQIAHSKTTIYDVPNTPSKAQTSSIFAGITSTWNIAFTPQHALFISGSFGGGGMITTVHRPRSVTTDEWTTYALYAQTHIGYIAKIERVHLVPYIGLAYRYTPEHTLTSTDYTQLTQEQSHFLYPSINCMIEYTYAGFRPYITTSFIFPQPLTRSYIFVQNRAREYTIGNQYATTLGLEYTHLFRYIQLTFATEIGIKTTLETIPTITPHIHSSLTITF